MASTFILKDNEDNIYGIFNIKEEANKTRDYLIKLLRIEIQVFDYYMYQSFEQFTNLISC